MDLPQDWLENYFGDSFPEVSKFASMLEAQGELRGLIGPRELPRLWRRHLVNSAVVNEFIPQGSHVADVGSGAGFPGIVIAIMRPDLEVTLIEPMQRRVDWLNEVKAELKLKNVNIHCAQAQELHGKLAVDVVTARAVANLSKLLRWCVPLLKAQGTIAVQKGERAQIEIDDARKTIKQLKLVDAQVHERDICDDGEITRVVTLARA